MFSLEAIYDSIALYIMHQIALQLQRFDRFAKSAIQSLCYVIDSVAHHRFDLSTIYSASAAATAAAAAATAAAAAAAAAIAAVTAIAAVLVH